MWRHARIPHEIGHVDDARTLDRAHSSGTPAAATVPWGMHEEITMHARSALILDLQRSLATTTLVTEAAALPAYGQDFRGPRGIPGVVTVVNRIAVGEEEARLADAARRHAEGDPALTESRWEGQRVGTGRRRQGNSAEPDRHADPKPKLESRWLEEQEAIRNAADDFAPAERRSRREKAATVRGVPKADHVNGEARS